jgi:hypothetical protein
VCFVEGRLIEKRLVEGRCWLDSFVEGLVGKGYCYVNWHFVGKLVVSVFDFVGKCD